MSYANPLYAGLGSDDHTCAKVIEKVLDALAYPDMRFEVPDSNGAFDPINEGRSFSHDCLVFRAKLFKSLRDSGWDLHYNDHKLTVRRKKQ